LAADWAGEHCGNRRQMVAKIRGDKECR